MLEYFYSLDFAVRSWFWGTMNYDLENIANENNE